MAAKHAHNAKEPVLDDERIAGEGDHAFARGPFLIGDAGIADDPIGQVRFSFGGNPANFELTHRDARVGAVKVRVSPGACLKLQHVSLFIERPDPGEGGIEMFHHRPGAMAEHLLQIAAFAHVLADARGKCVDTRLLLEYFLGFFLRGDIPSEAAGVDEFAVLEKNAGIDEHVADGSIFAEEARRIFAQGIAPDQACQNVRNDGLVGMEFGDLASDVFAAGVTKKIEFGLVSPENCSISGNPVKTDGGGFDEIAKIGFALPQGMDLSQQLILAQLRSRGFDRSEHQTSAIAAAPRR